MPKVAADSVLPAADSVHRVAARPLRAAASATTKGRTFRRTVVPFRSAADQTNATQTNQTQPHMNKEKKEKNKVRDMKPKKDAKGGGGLAGGGGGFTPQPITNPDPHHPSPN